MTKLILLSLFLTASAFAQVTITVKVDAGLPQTATLSPAVVASLTQFMATQTQRDPAFPNDPKKTVPKYIDLADLIYSHLRVSLFQNVLDVTPPAAIVTLKATRDTAQTNLDNAKKDAVK